MSGIESPVWCKLKTINADHNKLSSINTVGSCTCFDWKEDQSCLPQTLQTLSLNHNQIKTLSTSDSQLLYSLRELHLSGNNVEHLEVSVCGPRELLEGVSCSDEGDGYVTPYANLRELDLSANQLVTFPPCIMKLMPNLTVLNVSHNSLREFCVNTSLSAIISLEHLDLSDNKLKVIQPLLTLAQVPSLKNLSFNNNPWDCSSELTKDLLICQTGNQHRGFFIVIVGILITVCLAMLFVHIGCRKITPNIYYVLGWLPSAKDDATFTRQYSVFVVHSWEDNDMVKTDLVDPLNELGFSVAWNENTFMPGDNLDASIEKAVVSSRRMLVVVSKYLETFPKGKQIIERGLSEECSVPGFKVVALVMDNLPRQMCSVLHNIVIKRTYVPRQSSNYISTIREFLPALALSDHVIPFTETDIQGFLLRQMEIRKRRDNERAQLQEVFPFQYLDPSGSSVNTSITIQEIGPVEDFDRTRSEWHSTRF
ncbi:Leucine-rich repeat and fibronectin type-III domain-containing protein 4 [Chionoecetes opilio]|uniref:Leucine-rich repeat and fibronectin type-III domain-containing protein 4 n=1 Tax=Chionoecetes opilio TaxID=41210 RepID=A0A8J5CRD7_CHIOP|nr:Leucine-rich repeat and fibronectin type-III domain-containing protein 4 [Chionoecetes opilio]